jgi:hypothetical protein
MKHLPLILAAFLILIAGFVSSVISLEITGNAPYGATQRSYYRTTNYRAGGYGPGEIPLSSFDFNKDGMVDIDDVRDHNNVLRRCQDALYSSHCIPGLDIDGNGRYENVDNQVLYKFVLNPVNQGQSDYDAKQQRTDECNIGKLKCIGDARYQVCGNYDGDPSLEWSPILRVQEPGKWCRYGKIVTRHFNPDY